ncbi:MAG TPA: 2-oxoglutarate dehydrogenase E1 component, partial [Longimicrobiales bacterium]
MQLTDGFDTYNAGYVEEQYQRYVSSPASVDEAWRRFFGANGLNGAHGALAGDGAGALATGEQPALSPQALRVAVAAAALVDAYRLHGHLIANLNPLDGGSGTARPTGRHVQLEPEFYGITLDDLDTVPAAALGFASDGTACDIIEWLKSVYAGPIGYEYEHIADAERREWLREQIESGRFLQPLSPDEKKNLLRRLTALEALEQFLHKAYLGQKRFSGEGTDLLVPILDVAIERAAVAGAREVVIGMAHRGRLNVLAHILGVPYTRIVGEFEGVHPNNPGTGDVKYHIGGEGTYATASGQPLAVVLAPNPSHLEFVDAVVEGMVRAKQTDLHQPEGPRNEDAVLPVLIHGDAAFAGQGVVPETLNLMELAGFRTGGSLHVITNNQIGFTTNPRASRSTPYASDLAKGFDIPIFHVNADEPEACLSVARLAMEYRERFHTDVLIDLIGYRRYGHNEGDEPAYTQPRLYEKIASHPTVRRLWADRLIQQGLLTEADVEAEWQAAYGKFMEAQAQVKARPKEEDHAGNGGSPAQGASPQVATGVGAERLLELDSAIHSWPADFAVNPKLARQLERRAKALPDGNPIDWGHAEALALASLLTQGVPVRMTGQDVERGTFSQRHLVLHDVKTGDTYTPMAHLPGATAAFKLYNSPLSELAVLGFEYGYSVAEPDTLVLWEAQFGDFANGAQVIIDQFISAGHAKWNQESRLVLLLPHGAEGQGPEHTSARLERFLQLAAENEIVVADCSTPAQYFHLLRRQVLSPRRRPLVVMTPKSLLRHPKATSHLEDLAEGSFQAVLDDADARARAEQIRKVVLCTGKFYYDLVTSEARDKARDTAIVRVEELYPFPARALAQVLGAYPALETVVWAQEEPQNMGAGPYMETHLPRVLPEGVRLGYAGRPE